MASHGLDLSASHVWDASSVAALDAVEARYAALGKSVDIQGLRGASMARHDHLAGHLGVGH